jgi:hypothetical protein
VTEYETHPKGEQASGSSPTAAPRAAVRAVPSIRNALRARAEPLVAAAAIVAVVASVVRFAPPTYTVEPGWTDHMQHEYDAWAFLQIGFRIFYVPMRDWAGVHALHPHLLWDSLPAIYPPGLVVFFMPFGVASNEGVVSDLHVHMLMVMTLGAAGVLAAFQLRRTLRLSYDPILGAILTFLGAVLFVHWGLDGFIDPLAAGLALLGIYWLRRDEPGRALLALTVALSLHYRLWYLWPLVLALAIERRHEIRRWQLAGAAVIGVASIVAFLLSFPYEGNFHTNPAINPNGLSITHGVSLEQWVAVAGGCVVVVVTAFFDRIEAALTVTLAFVMLFAVDEWEAWYPVLLLPLLAVVRTRPAQIAVTLAFLQAVVYLGGMPNVMQTVHAYIDAVR